MSQPNPTPDNNDQNIIELNEQPEVKQKPAIPPRKLREIKQVNYSKFFPKIQTIPKIISPKKAVKSPNPQKKSKTKIGKQRRNI